MSTDERWLDFRYQYIETGWFDYDRCKTIKAMRKLSERIPEHVLDSFPPLTVFAPSNALLGHVLPCGTVDSIFVYLSPKLESKLQREVDFTVAHEFAHIALGHYRPGATTLPSGTTIAKHEDAPTEQDADEIAVSWGFSPPPRPRERANRRHKSAEHS